MIDLYTWPTPNGWKVTIALEEMDLDYRIVPVDIGQGVQFGADFTLLSPNQKIPAIVDHEPSDGAASLSLFESGAILMYLAEKSDRFIPRKLQLRETCRAWLFWQTASLGPMLGQAHHFRCFARDKVEYAIERYTREATRLYRVLDEALGRSEYLCGDYSIADMACWPWVTLHEMHGQSLSEFSNVSRWYSALNARPPVRRGHLSDRALVGGLSVSSDGRRIEMSEAAKTVLFAAREEGEQLG